MSMSDSDFSSFAGELKTFRQMTRDRLLYEMIRSAKSKDSKSSWKVLITDELTVRILSVSCKMADITEEGVSLVEDIHKRRQPMPSMDAVYFIQPSKEKVIMFLSDMSGKKPLYKKAFVFFSSPISKELVALIKKDGTVSARIGALREMNLEYFAFDSQELPFVRYRTAKSLDACTMTTYRDLIPTKLAAGVWNCLTKYKTTIPNFPQTETCELLILDRSVDQIAPIIHEWTYDAMCHDLLDFEGGKYVHEVPSKTGESLEKKEVILDEHDPLWLELRHTHIADASERLHDKMTNFVANNKAAQIQHGSRNGAELSTRDLQKMIEALPQYSEQMEKLSLHVEIAGKVNNILREQGLRDLGQLEQDLVFGDAGTKELINFLRTKQDVSQENKLRLLMIFAAAYPEKFQGEHGSKLVQLAKLPSDDMIAIRNLKLLEGVTPEAKKSTSAGFSLKFDIHKDLIEKLSKGELSKNDYPCMNDPSPTFHGTNPGSMKNFEAPAGHSVRTRRTASWARPRNSDDGYTSDSLLRRATSEIRRVAGQRIFVFMIGGATRSELRACHKLTTKLKREVILGTSNIVDPPSFITKVKSLSFSDGDNLSLDDIHI